MDSSGHGVGISGVVGSSVYPNLSTELLDTNIGDTIKITISSILQTKTNGPTDSSSSGGSSSSRQQQQQLTSVIFVFSFFHFKPVIVNRKALVCKENSGGKPGETSSDDVDMTGYEFESPLEFEYSIDEVDR